MLNSYTNIYLFIWLCIHKQISQCIRQLSHNAPFCNRNVNASSLLLQNSALWDMGLVHCSICATDLCGLLTWSCDIRLFNIGFRIVVLSTLCLPCPVNLFFYCKTTFDQDLNTMPLNLNICLPLNTVHTYWKPYFKLFFMFYQIQSVVIYETLCSASNGIDFLILWQVGDMIIKGAYSWNDSTMFRRFCSLVYQT